MNLPRRIDLNADVAESSDQARMEREVRLLESVTSVNIACGLHAGSPELMRWMVRLAQARGIAIGAHPGLSDRAGGGRRILTLSPDDTQRLVIEQVKLLAGICADEDVPLVHVKPHGALYNMAARDRALADAIARAIRSVDAGLILIGLAGSDLIGAGTAAGLRTAEEAFVDRAYRPDRTLVPRDEPEAVIHDEQTVVARALSLACEGTVSCTDGSLLSLRADTLCLHGDTPEADRLAKAVRQALTDAGIVVDRMDHASC